MSSRPGTVTPPTSNSTRSGSYHSTPSNKGSANADSGNGYGGYTYDICYLCCRIKLLNANYRLPEVSPRIREDLKSFEQTDFETLTQAFLRRCSTNGDSFDAKAIYNECLKLVVPLCNTKKMLDLRDV
jgi:hypothetical protein